MLGRILVDLLGFARTRGRSATDANPLAEYFFQNPGRLIDKWHHYLEVYHRHFAPFRGRSPVVVEIGVSQGGSLEMWRHYFGPGARIVGIDVDPRCARFAAPSIDVLIGSQSDRSFLARVRERYPHVDLVIDDGGHWMEQQRIAFEELYPHVQPNGLYVCEDMHSSYWECYGGGLHREGTFVELAKSLVDRLHAWHSEEAHFAVDAFTRSAFALHFYDSILVIEKRPMQPPTASKTGRPSFDAH